MRKAHLFWLVLVLMVVALPAGAVVDNGDGTCVQSDGQRGLFNGTTLDDAGCVTPEEYRALYSPENLVTAGVFDAVVDNGDGTVTGTLADTGISVVVESDPMDRTLAATPRLEPDAPKIADYWRARGLSVYPV